MVSRRLDTRLILLPAPMPISSAEVSGALVRT